MKWEARTVKPQSPSSLSTDTTVVTVNEYDDGKMREEQTAQYKAAIAAAAHLMDSLGGDFTVSVSGSANPGGKSRGDLPSEHVTITVWRATGA